jgi:glycosyltransferase involved in cell wall biosynthesis
MANITTVIPVFNGEKYIRETLESLARQTVRPDRVVVVDDRSTDRTEQIVRSFPGLTCEWAPNDRNLGLFPNHNSALRFTKETKYFHILHSNDLISPTFFEKLIPLVEDAPGFAMAWGGHVFIREDGSETSQKGAAPVAAPSNISLKQFLEWQTELKSIQLHSAVLKTSFQECPVQFRTDLPQLGDVVFHAQFAAHCSSIWADPEILCQVRIHGDSATNRNIRNINAWVLDEWKAMQLVCQTLKEKNLLSRSRTQKLKLLFAARSQVKMKMIRGQLPELAEQIRASAEPLTGKPQWIFAGIAVALRDRFLPKSDAAAERLQNTK